MKLNQELNMLEKHIRDVASEMDKLKRTVPVNSRLRAVKHGNVYQYFARNRESGMNGEYIKEKDRKKAVALAQIEYDEKLLKILQKNMEVLLGVCGLWSENPTEEAYHQMSLGKRELVKVPVISAEEYLNNWLTREYTGKDFPENYPEFYTRKGLRVRSKSEVMISDILDEMSLPFLYEKPLLLSSGTIYPDFTLLDLKERREIYWEHFGMMDDMDYRNNAFLKMKKYESGGLFQSDSMIYTFETGRNPLNTKSIRRMVSMLKNKLGYALEEDEL